MFRRRRRDDADQAGPEPGRARARQAYGDDEDGTGWGDGGQAEYGGQWEDGDEDAAGGNTAGQEAAGREAAGLAVTAPGAGPPAGPWDVDEGDVPAADRIDFGSLRVPVGEGLEVQIGMAENQAAWITVVRGESGLQLQAFAAPKSGGLWDNVRGEIAADVAQAGGECQEADGPFGIELRARIAAPDAAHGGGRGRHAGHGLQPVRFLGVDGPRWFLRGVITGPAARRDELARPLERVFGGIVVVRGDHPVPPRDLLEIQLPEEARQALGAEPEPEEPEGGRWAIGPFGHGPEITETR